MSWALGGTIMFTMYTELSNIFNGAVCLLVGLWQLGGVFTGRELPLWLKQLKFISTSCLAMTFLTVVIILAPMYEAGALRASAPPVAGTGLVGAGSDHSIRPV